jgi:hypothetical protein
MTHPHARLSGAVPSEYVVPVNSVSAYVLCVRLFVCAFLAHTEFMLTINLGP